MCFFNQCLIILCRLVLLVPNTTKQLLMERPNLFLSLFLICLLINNVSMKCFPLDFKFGVATASYQIEGAWDVDGKSENLWDYYTHTFPEKILDRSNGDVACNAYYKTNEDISNLKQLKVDFYRFSLSWCRILPSGYKNSLNPAGVRYYNELIDKLLKNGIEPVVTLFHWDLPLNFHEIGGWTNIKMVDYFADYVRVCFGLFGDRVKTWITFNEPSQILQLGYGQGILAPFYNLDGTAPYLGAYTLLLAHAKAYHIYKNEFKQKQKGRVGITVETSWYVPKTNSFEDKEAAERALQMYFGWFVHPIFSQAGDYPKVMRERIDYMSAKQDFSESRLPRFTHEQVKEIRGTSDFLGLNHYTTFLVEHNPNVVVSTKPAYYDDMAIIISVDEEWEGTARDVFKVAPWGLRELLKWIKNEYHNPEVIITENGYAGFENETTNDFRRIKYYNGYLEAVLDAITIDKCHVTSYTAWSFMDNFEWMDGYTMRFGMYYVDFEDKDRPRTPKKSAYVYQNIIVTRKINRNLIPYKFLY